jgi:hypothetical protein
LGVYLALSSMTLQTIGRVRDLAQREADRLLANIRAALLFLDHRDFVFFPDPANPASGW